MRNKFKVKRVALLVTEMSTNGGMQTYMRRISDVFESIATNNNIIFKAYIYSLNDDTYSLLNCDEISNKISVWGASKSKSALITQMLFKMPCMDLMLVGHLSAGPLAHILKITKKVDSYCTILHGIESWRKVSFIERMALLGAESLIVTTQYTATECAQSNKISDSKFIVIPLCVTEKQISINSRFKLKGGFKLLCVARQDFSEKDKGFEDVFFAIYQLCHDFPDLNFNLVGNGDFQPHLKQLSKSLEIEKNITFWGELSLHDITAAYQQCDVFVMPSKKEGFGIVFIEAMRFGKPCIGGNHGGTPYIIKHGKSGYLVNNGDVEMLVEYIRKMITDNSLRELMSASSKQVIEDNYTFDKFEKRFLELVHGKEL